MKKVYLIYPRAHRHTGSTVMRTFQLKKIIENYGCQKVNIQLAEVSNFRISPLWMLWIEKFERNSLAIFCKYAIDRVPIYILKNLKARNIKIAVDYIDRGIDSLDIANVDIHIASSSRQQEFLKSLTNAENVVKIAHFGDIDIFKNGCTPPRTKKKSICYLGEIRNLFLPEKYISNVNILPYRGQLTPSLIQEASQYRFHYCVRPQSQNEDLNFFKPATKVMNCIGFGVIPIISRDQEDAINILGENYPFIIREFSDSEFEKIFTMTECGFEEINFAQTKIKILQEKFNLQAYACSCENILLQMFALD